MNEQQKKEEGSACSMKLSCTVCCVCVCAAICFIAYLSIPHHEESPRRLWLPVVVETNGNETILGDSRQLEFWTPSVKTKEYLHKDGGQVVTTEKWESIPSDDVVFEFGSVLHTNRNVLGYRRMEVWGQGRTNYKPGWWWTVNVLSNYTAGEMGRTYQDFWKSSQPVFIEVIDNRGHGE